MSRQRNEPNDPSAELAGYDLDNSEGTSPSDTGEVTTEAWPSNVDKNDFNETGQKIVRRWVQSHWEKPTTEAISSFAETIDDASIETVRKNVLKAQQHKIREDYIRPSERLAIQILAYEDDRNPKEIAKEYPISYQVLQISNYAFGKIIDSQDPSISKVKEEVERYKNGPTSSGSTTDDTSEYEKAREDLMEYFINNQDADAHDAIAAVDYDPNWQSVNSLRSNLIKHGKMQPDDSETEANTQSETGFEVTLQLSKDEAREIVLGQELSEQLQNQIVNTILDEVGL